MSTETKTPTESKIPSPKDIKKTPIKFTPQEIEELNSYQSRMNNLIYGLGQLKLTEIQIKDQETQIKQTLIDLKKIEKQTAEKLSKKYGQGSLDIESGTFIPAQ